MGMGGKLYFWQFHGENCWRDESVIGITVVTSCSDLILVHFWATAATRQVIYVRRKCESCP
jgi:hypothetical protein